MLVVAVVQSASAIVVLILKVALWWIYLQCMQCGRRFDWPSGLERHVKGVHLNVRYPCDVCGKLFTQYDNLKRHKRLKHLQFAS